MVSYSCEIGGRSEVNKNKSSFPLWVYFTCPVFLRSGTEPMMMSLKPVKEFQLLARWSFKLRLIRQASSLDNRCRTSKLLQPLNLIPHGGEVPSKSPKKFEDVSSKSSRLLQDLGFVRPASPGTFVYLNLALRSLEKLISLADVVMEEAGCQKILLPSLVDLLRRYFLFCLVLLGSFNIYRMPALIVISDFYSFTFIGC